jgi:hypothetical protein
MLSPIGISYGDEDPGVTQYVESSFHPHTFAALACGFHMDSLVVSAQESICGYKTCTGIFVFLLLFCPLYVDFLFIGNVDIMA